MCGIFALLNNNNNSLSNDFVKEQFMKGKFRGPEFSKLNYDYMKMLLGFHRLAINGLDDISNQPLIYNNIVLICNGEIYNYKQLYREMKIVPTTNSDCEVIIHLYLKYGIEQTLIMLDGVFSFVLYDNRVTDSICNNVYIARDPYGVRPLYYLKSHNDNNNSRLQNIYGFASELKCLIEIYKLNTSYFSIEQFTPGTYSTFELNNQVNACWRPKKENFPYISPSFSYTNVLKMNNIDELNSETYCYFKRFSKSIARHLINAVTKRCITTERPVSCLLSGGLDSSLIAALVNNYYRTNNIQYKLKTYSIGLKGSEDLKYAKIVADYLETDHTEIIVSEQEMFDIIPEVIHAIESYDTTTVRASIGNYLLGKYISTHSDTKVIFNGDGSDELFGGYLYMNKCPDDIEFDKESRRLLKDIHAFDVLRSDKCISSHGLEPRTPFLDRSLVNYVLSIPPYFRNHKNFNTCEKNILRSGFTIDNFQDSIGRQILPDEILWRKKEAFSDGVSCQGRSLYVILQEKIVEKMLTHNRFVEASIETEKKFYKEIFTSHYPEIEQIVPYYWMPKYTTATDPSARTLNFYAE